MRARPLRTADSAARSAEGHPLTGGWIRIPCNRAHRLLSARMDAPLAAGQVWRLRLHLLFCDACTKVDRHLMMMREAMRRLGS